MGYIKISFADLQPEQKEILIAQLADAGYIGFEETDTTLDAFIFKKDFDTSVLIEIAFKYQLNYQSEMIAETNWNQIWESNFQPVIVDDYVAIRAGFHSPITNVKYEIVITPKMSFGTGHHATTYMMIQLMKEIDFTDKSVLDFGTGTGILAILAEKSGAASITAIDNDDWSIENAAENFKSNSCDKIILEKASAAPSNKKFDIILANINKSVIIDNVEILAELLKPGAAIMFSGLLQNDKQDLLEAVRNLNLKPGKNLIRDNWIALQFHK